jgi:hypothetical protein
VQAPEGSDPADRDGDRVGHPRDNPAVEEDPPAADLADVDQLLGVLVLSSTPTEPEVTDVTSASTARVLIGDHHRIRARMLSQPVAGLVVEGDDEFQPTDAYCDARRRACARWAARRNSRTCRSWPSTYAR